MLFNSLHFLAFFILVTPTYFLLPHRFRWILLLSASCYFYMAFVPVYILILGFTIVVDYFAGIWIEQSSGKKKKWFLIASLIANIGVLAIFKYYNFINDNLTYLMHGAGFENPIPYLPILLPIGLSFHTFQAMSYTIEVYRGKQQAERNFGLYALYVMFYPQLVAGPIERPQNLLHQFRTHHYVDYELVTSGLKLIIWGFFKKLVIADRLALYVNATYGNVEHHNGSTLLLATVFFAFQIYCDFSGYSDIALGTARIMGFTLMTNFKRPYFADSISEFWKRWHISLSTWFKDYIYLPMGGNRVSIPRWYINLLVVFMISGLWHGANWTFIIWGALNGFYLIMAIVAQPSKEKISKILGLTRKTLISRVLAIAATFALTCLAWVFFRAQNVTDAFVILKKILTAPGPVYRENITILAYGFAGIVFLIAVEAWQEYVSHKENVFTNPTKSIQVVGYVCLILAILLFGVFDGGQFIYFQF